jgi:hypothetical protein
MARFTSLAEGQRGHRHAGENGFYPNLTHEMVRVSKTLLSEETLCWCKRPRLAAECPARVLQIELSWILPYQAFSTDFLEMSVGSYLLRIS